MRSAAVLLALALGAVSPLAAQATGAVRGVVTDSLKNPIPGARVVIPGTSAGTVSRADGSYRLAGAPLGRQTVRISAIGFEAQNAGITIEANQTAVLNITMRKAVAQLAAVAVVGYGTQQRREVTGSVTTVAAEAMKDIPTNDPMKALQGRMAGVEIVTNSNEPGAPMQVRVRGVRSMSSGRNEPLYVVDGIPISGGIEDFNPQIIDNITVLKDAAATAIYGSRGANGVILVTTKRGPSDGKMRTQFSLDSYYGAQQPVRVLEMMPMQNFVKYLQDAALFNGQDTSLAKVLQGQTFVPGTTTSKRLYAYQNGIETDWLRAVLRDGLQRNFQGSVSGAMGGTRYTMSGNFFDQQGAIPGQANTRGNAFLSLDYSTPRFKVGMSTSLSRSLVKIGAGQQAYAYASAMTPFGRALNYTTPDSAGLFDPRPDDDPLNINPILEAQSMIRENTGTRVFASAFAEVTLPKGFRYRLNFGPDYNNQGLGCFNDLWTHGNCGTPNSFSSNQGQPPQAGFRSTTSFAYTLDNLLSWDRDIGSNQRVEVTGLYSIQRDRFTSDSSYAQQLPYSSQRWYDLGSGVAGNQASLLSEWALQSYMARVNYTLFNRYTLSATSRADGSSRLAPGNKWAFFPSASIAWNISDEPFMRRFGAVDQLKLRASYGTTGNTSIAPYQTQGLLGSRFYTFGTTRVRGFRPGALPNPDLTWEKTDEQNFGLDYGFWNSRVSGSVDYYVQDTRDLLLTRLLPATSGFTSTLQNIGATRNTGIDLAISTVNVRDWNGLTWSTDFNWSRNRNRIRSLASGSAQDVANVWFVGQPINFPNGDPQRRVFYDWKYTGVWQIADSAAMRAFNTNGATFKAGDPRVADINGDGRINADDRTIVGTSYPAWTAGLTNRLTWKGFDVSALITAKWNYTIADGTPRSYTGRQGVINDMDYWMPDNPTNRNPAPNVGQVERLYATSRLYADGSHWRVRNVTVGYTMSPELLRRFGVARMRLYGTAQDPYINSSYIGIDPEVAGAAPTMRTLLFGTNISW